MKETTGWLNLQLFAEGGGDVVNATGGYVNAYTGANEAFTPTNSLDPTMKTFYNKQLLENVRNKHYFAQFGSRQPLPAHSGKQMEWRKMRTLPLADVLTEGVIPEGKDGHTVALEIPCYLLMVPYDESFDLCALGLWMSTDLLISVECDDIWDLFTDEDREYFGVQTRDAFQASYENQGLCDILMRAYAFLNLDWTYVEINGALYITRFRNISTIPIIPYLPFPGTPMTYVRCITRPSSTGRSSTSDSTIWVRSRTTTRR